VIINGDTKGRHLGNVDRALENVLIPQGYTTFVASPSKPSVSHDHYFSGDREGIEALLKQLEERADPNTELVLYTTGHGVEEGFCLESDCKTQDLLARLGRLPFDKKRVVVMDQCYGGGFVQLFSSDPKTLFTSAGSRGEADICQQIAPYLWAPSGEVPDENKDGAISWQERFAYAVEDRKISSEPQFVVSAGYVWEGKPPFSNKVQDIADEAALQQALGRLRPGQYAVITFSADWCGPCKTYAPGFEGFASKGAGQHLYLKTENEALAEQWGVQGYPTVMVVSWRGDRRVVEDRNAVPEELAGFEVPLEKRLSRKIEMAEKIEDDQARAVALRGIAVYLAEANLGEKAVALFDKSIAAAEKIENDQSRSTALSGIAFYLAEANLEEKAVALFDKSIAATEKIENDWARTCALRDIAYYLAEANLKEKAVALFDKLIAAAEKIKDDQSRAVALRDIASRVRESGLSDRIRVPTK
ncbi:MAG: thioredoxin domain-containing protein, partial [Deltaproteobacteria bacterium]|nr:thioredoxin domain-containing protein [Deltaproteobacteria bacterium]